jgi:hypothetical protein
MTKRDTPEDLWLDGMMAAWFWAPICTATETNDEHDRREKPKARSGDRMRRSGEGNSPVLRAGRISRN